MPFTIVRQDITKMKVDATVNATNTDLAVGGVCGAIFKAAGARELQAACDKIAPIKIGETAAHRDSHCFSQRVPFTSNLNDVSLSLIRTTCSVPKILLLPKYSTRLISLRNKAVCL